jgi:esterase/lipase
MKKPMRLLAIFLIGASVFYLLGPKPAKPEYDVSLPEVPAEPAQLEQFIAAQEHLHKLRPDNEARIIWYNDSLKARTEYAIVYLHGFSASQEEGDPVHYTIAKKYGCNLYLSRLAEHGIDTTEQLVNLTVDAYWESAKQAFAIGKQLGKKIILMGTSTGGTQALQLASTYPDDVAALVLMSPNIAINDPNAWLLNNHWGLQLAEMVTGSNYITPKDERPIYKQYWNSPYRLEAAVQLEEMLETTMTSATFKKIHQPLLMMYYYKDKKHQDEVVKVDAMLQMFDDIATPADKKKKVAIPNAGDHVIGSYIKSKDVPSVMKATDDFFAWFMQQ